MENLKKTEIWRKFPPTLDFLVALQDKRQSNDRQTRSNAEMCGENCAGEYTVSCSVICCLGLMVLRDVEPSGRVGNHRTSGVFFGIVLGEFALLRTYDHGDWGLIHKHQNHIQ